MKPNILLVIMDGVRAENTSLHGYKRETTPFLEDFAQTATHYTQTRTPAGNSLTSHTSIFTGLHVDEHKLTDPTQSLRPNNTIWEQLSKEHGYSTGVFSSNTFLTQVDCGLQDAFETVYSGQQSRLPFPNAVNPKEYTNIEDTQIGDFVKSSILSSKPIRSLINGASMRLSFNDMWFVPEIFQTSRTTGDIFTDKFLGWIDDSNGPWAATINYMDTHTPYLPDDEFNKWGSEELKSRMKSVDNFVWSYHSRDRQWDELSQFMDLYDGAILQVDNEIRRLITALSDRGELENTLVMITADHGEGFGEYSNIRDSRCVGHGNPCGPEEQLFHVPHVVKFPGQSTGFESERLSSLIYFKEAVQNCINQTWDVSDFVNPHVLSKMIRMNEITRERSSRILDDISTFEPSAEVVYTEKKGKITKHVRWNGKISTQTLGIEKIDNQGEHSRDVVEAAWENLDEKSVLTGTRDEINENTKQRLKDLGYA